MADPVSDQLQKLIDEGPIGMAETARLLGTFRGGRPCHPSTPTRWCLSGVRLADGGILRLEHYRSARRLMTSKAAVLRFLAAQQGELPEPPPRSPSQRDRDSEVAEAELRRLGV